MNKKLTIFISFWLISSLVWGQSSCSRTAQINFQDVLVDSSSNLKGEGLRYYLSKDPKSLKLLDQYQEESKSTWRSAAMSTGGTGLILASLLRPNETNGDELTSRTTLLFGGMTMILLSFLISKTREVNNEHLLLKSIEEYNKSNTPKIYFNPTSASSNQGAGISIGMLKDF